MVDFKYCPKCKKELELSGEYPKCFFCDIIYYKNSKPTASILPIKEGKVLLSKRGIEPYIGKYDIIGGFLKNGEDPKVGAKREALEETGLTIEPKEMLGIYMDRYGEDDIYTLNIHYIGDITGGVMKAKDDVASLHWFDIGNLPSDLGFQNTKNALKDLQKRFRK